MKLSIIIPVYNERSTLEEIIRRVRAVNLGQLEREIVVVDDGSTDGTRDIIQKISDIHYVFHEKNLGKGGAVKTGFRTATGDIVIIQDADLEYNPNEIVDVIKPILDGRALAANGVRIQPPRDIRRKKSYYWIMWAGGKLITTTTNFLYWHNAQEYSGCYKAFSKKVVDATLVETDDFDFENELMCKLLRKKVPMVDVPIHYYPRSYGEGKKIRFRHGIKMLWAVIRWRFKRMA